MRPPCACRRTPVSVPAHRHGSLRLAVSAASGPDGGNIPMWRQVAQKLNQRLQQGDAAEQDSRREELGQLLMFLRDKSDDFFQDLDFDCPPSVAWGWVREENRLSLQASEQEELQAVKRKIKELQALLELPAWQRLLTRYTRPAGAFGMPLTADEVMDILTRGETSLAEFRHVTLNEANSFDPSLNDIAKQGCAFANSAQGGVLLYGIHDSPQQVVGVESVDPALLNQFVTHVSTALDSAYPPITCCINTVQVPLSDGSPVLVVAVDIPPARELTSAGQPRTVYQQAGDSTRTVEGAALAELRRHWQAMRAWGDQDAGDVFPVEGAYISRFMDTSAIKLQSLGIDLRKDKAPLQQRLCMMQLAQDIGGPEPVLTVSGLLLLGSDRSWQEDLTLCSTFLIKVLVCNDDDPPGTPASKCTMRHPREYLVMGNALNQVDQAVTLIDALTGLEYEIRDAADSRTIASGAPRGVQYRQYPLVALRELLVNAIVHRSYFMERGGQVVIKVRHRSLEIISPGALPPGLTSQALSHGSAYSCPRNRVLSWFMHRLSRRGGRVFEGHGLGIARARQLIDSSGGTLSYKELPAGAVVAMVTAGRSCEEL